MKIQIVGENSYGYSLSSIDFDITTNTFSSIEGLAYFDITFIDLQSKSLWNFWCNRNFDISSFSDMASSIYTSENQKVLIALPTECFLGLRGFSEVHNNSRVYPLLGRCTQSLINEVFDIGHEKNVVTLNGVQLETELFFRDTTPSGFIPIIKSNISKRILLLKKNSFGRKYNNQVSITTMRVIDEETLPVILKVIGVEERDESIPEWLEERDFFNDSEEKNKRAKALEEIETQKKIIDNCDLVLSKNRRYKSILISSGNHLVSVVFDILQKILNCDLSSFVDEKKEDFNIQLENYCFIGEIKGVSKGIRRSNISQVETNMQLFLEAHPEFEDKCKPVLIITPQRDISVSDRESVSQDVISHAIKHNCLVITTDLLLDLFEVYLQGKIDPKQCEKVFREQNGLLNLLFLKELKE